jgi:serine/threonine protein kinase
LVKKLNILKLQGFAGIGQIHGITKHPASNEFALVMEYYKHGDLRSTLSKGFNALTWEVRAFIAYQIACSIYHAHNVNIIHCDIHSGNIFVDENEVALTDFGLSRIITDIERRTNGNGSYGVVPYMAPELFRGATYSKASDIYALGIVMWELSAGEQPFSDCDHDAELVHRICDGKRPTIMDGTPDCWIQLMTKCWEGDPSKRPTAHNVMLETDGWSKYPIISSNINVLFQFDKADKFRRCNPKPLQKLRHSGPEYRSRFVPSITLG